MIVKSGFESGWDSELERPVAVKVVRTGIDAAAARHRLLGEARETAALERA